MVLSSSNDCWVYGVDKCSKRIVVWMCIVVKSYHRVLWVAKTFWADVQTLGESALLKKSLCRSLRMRRRRGERYGYGVACPKSPNLFVVFKDDCRWRLTFFDNVESGEFLRVKGAERHRASPQYRMIFVPSTKLKSWRCH